MVVYSCCAINCENNKTSRPDLIFFHFPSYNPKRSWEWVVNLGRIDLLGKDVNDLWRSYVVCADHFERHYFTDEQRRKLVCNAVPTIFNHCSHDVDVPLILEALKRIQSGAAAVDGHDEQIQATVECKQQSQKVPPTVNSQPSKPKSYKCQLCTEIFISAHQLFSHELRDHEHVGILNIDSTKQQQLPKYQREKVYISESGVHDTNMDDRNLWKEISNLKNSRKHEEIPHVETSGTRGTSQQHDENQKSHVSSVRGKSRPMDGKLQAKLCDRRKSQKRDQNQQTHTFSMGGSSQMQGGNQQADNCNMGKKSQKQDGKTQTHTFSMGQSSQSQNGNPQIETSDTTRNPEKHYKFKACPEIFTSSHSVHQHQSRVHDCESEVDAQNMNNKQARDTLEVCSLELEGSILETKRHDKNAYLVCKESFVSDSQQVVCGVQDHNKETELLQQGGGQIDSTVRRKGEENVPEVVNLPEVILPPSKGTSLPYKCHVCEEYFGKKCDLFYHDLQVHVGISKPTTIKSWNKSFKDVQNNFKEKIPNKGYLKRKVKNIAEEWQTEKVIITDTQTTDEQRRHKVKNPVAQQETLKNLCDTDSGNKPIQKCIMKQRVVQVDGKIIEVRSVNHEQLHKTIEADTGTYPWNKTVERGQGSELDAQGGETQPKTFVVVKDGPQSGKGNQNKSGRYRIDVVTNYVVTASQVKQFLMNHGGSRKE